MFGFWALVVGAGAGEGGSGEVGGDLEVFVFGGFCGEGAGVFLEDEEVGDASGEFVAGPYALEAVLVERVGFDEGAGLFHVGGEFVDEGGGEDVVHASSAAEDVLGGVGEGLHESFVIGFHGGGGGAVVVLVIEVEFGVEVEVGVPDEFHVHVEVESGGSPGDDGGEVEPGEAEGAVALDSVGESAGDGQGAGPPVAATIEEGHE